MFILHLFLCLFLGSLEVIQDDEVVAILGEQRKAKKKIFINTCKALFETLSTKEMFKHV
jgi:hypothetical protein